MLDAWLRQRRGHPQDQLFLRIRKGKFSHDAIERLLKKYAAVAARARVSLKRKKVSPHVLRHTAAMDLLNMESTAP